MKDEIKSQLEKDITASILKQENISGEYRQVSIVIARAAVREIEQNYIPKERVLTREELAKQMNDNWRIDLGETRTERFNALAKIITKAGSIEKVGVKDIETQEKKAINWLKVRVGKLMGCTLVKRDEVYKIAIRALENQQAMKDGAKPLNNLKEKE